MAAVTVDCHKSKHFFKTQIYINNTKINVFLNLICKITDSDGCHVGHLHDNRQGGLPFGIFVTP